MQSREAVGDKSARPGSVLCGLRCVGWAIPRARPWYRGDDALQVG